MDTVFYNAYELRSLSGKAVREGALLRIDFSDGKTGYADCHPWPELGDLPLKEQLSCDKLNPTALMKRSFHFARLDADCRVKGEHFLKNLIIPSSHFLLSTIDDIKKVKEEGFTHVKIKVRKETADEAITMVKLLSDLYVKVRIDFNHCFSKNEFVLFLEKISPYHSAIDFCEDPFRYDVEGWQSIQKQGIVLARDRLHPSENREGCVAKVAIWKPAVEQEISTAQRLVITSYLDHPVGQICAAYEAGRVLKEGRAVDVSGLLSHRGYLLNAFSEQLSQKGSAFTYNEGTGVGFDSLFSRIRWTPCK